MLSAPVSLPARACQQTARQGRRTQLREDTSTALFIFDALGPMADEALHGAADELVAHLTRLGCDVQVDQRLIAAP